MSIKFRFLSICLSVLSVIGTLRLATNSLRQNGGIKGHTVLATAGPSALIRSLRPIYPYSVIAGGAYSPGELQYAHGKDDVVRTHYSDFDVNHAKIVTLTDDRFQYVSYRLKDHIFWTKKRLRIPKGELLLTDGVNFARARCGNRLSDTPHQAATNLHEPDPLALSLPPVTSEMLPKMAMATPPPLAPSLNGIHAEEQPTTPQAQTGAMLPAELPSGISPVSASWPDEPVQTGFAPAYAGAPASEVERKLPPTTVPPITILPPVTPLPVKPPTPGPPDSTPIPEPNTLGLFLATLIISVWALVRMTPKEEPKS
jgi:hypothetical protein